MGHVEKRTRTRVDGSRMVTWRARYRTPAGRERVRTFKRKIDADRFLTTVEADKLKGVWVDPRLARMTVGELAEAWYETTAPLKATTRADYRSLLDKQVLPAFRGHALAAVDQLAVRAWIARLVEGGLSASRTRHAHAVLSAVLEAAVANGRLQRNPAKGVRLPRIGHREMRFLTAAQVEQLAAEVGAPYDTLVRFAAYTGLRAGEIVALRVRYLDLLHGTVRVVASTADVSGELIGGPTKTYVTRTVRLPRFLRAELAAYLAGRPHGPGGPDDFVFTSPAGGQLRHNNMAKRAFKPAVLRAGLDAKLRFHDLRHTCASLLIAQGASVKAVQAHLGHASATVTLDRYGHLFPDELEHLADRLDEIHASALAGGRRPGRPGRPGRRRRPRKAAHGRTRPRRDPKVLLLPADRADQDAVGE
jgi:integrase